MEGVGRVVFARGDLVPTTTDSVMHSYTTTSSSGQHTCDRTWSSRSRYFLILTRSCCFCSAVRVQLVRDIPCCAPSHQSTVDQMACLEQSYTSHLEPPRQSYKRYRKLQNPSGACVMMVLMVLMIEDGKNDDAVPRQRRNVLTITAISACGALQTPGSRKRGKMELIDRSTPLFSELPLPSILINNNNLDEALDLERTGREM